MNQRAKFSRLATVVAIALLGAVLGGCEMEETIRIAGDGSGSYEARISLDAEFAEALAKIRTEGEQKGFRVLDQGQSGEESFIVLGREFSSIGEIGDEEDQYALEIDQESLLRASYQLSVRVGGNAAASGFARVLRIEMPVPITHASGGQVDGDTVVWDSSNGGSIVVEAAGFALPVGRNQGRMVIGLAALLPVLLIVLRLRGRGRPRCCAGCGGLLSAGSRFCVACGEELVQTASA